MERFLSKNNDTKSTTSLEQCNDDASETFERPSDDRKRKLADTEVISKHSRNNDSKYISAADLANSIKDDNIEGTEKKTTCEEQHTSVTGSSNQISDPIIDKSNNELFNRIKKDQSCTKFKWTELQNAFSQDSNING